MILDFSVADDPTKPPGHALIRVGNFGLPPQPVYVEIRRVRASQTYLGAEGWQTPEVSLPVAQVSGEGDALVLHVGPEITRHIETGQTVSIRLWLDVGGKVYGEGRLPWQGVSAPLGTAEGGRRGRLAADPLAAPAPPPQPEMPPVAEPAPALVADERPPEVIETPPPPPPKSKMPLVFAGLAALIVLGGAGWYAWQQFGPKAADKTAEAQPAPTPTPPPATAALENRDNVRDYLAGNPAPGEATKRADELMKQGKPDLALLVYRSAADRGDAQAALSIGRMYDPETWTKETSPLPAANPEIAIDWYHKSAEAGVAEAQRRLGKLLAKGNSAVPADAEKSAFWLKKAADQGDAEAAEQLKNIK